MSVTTVTLRWAALCIDVPFVAAAVRSVCGERTRQMTSVGGAGRETPYPREHRNRRALSRLGAQQHLDCTTVIHRLIALGHLVERQLQVEHLARVDLPVPDQLDELRQEAAYRCRSTMEMDVTEEELVSWHPDVVGDTDVADVATGASGPNRLHHR